MLAQGIYVENATPSEFLYRLSRRLYPIKTQFNLIRIGGHNDGGYLLPDDLDDIVACFSPGVADNASFEQDLFLKTGIESHLTDYSVDGPPTGFIPKTFLKKYLATTNGDTTITLDAWVKTMEGDSDESDCILQMDIEGAEYSVLLGCSIETLRKFRVIVLEVHSIHAWGQRNFFNIVESVFEKLLQYFCVVHNHPNNNDGLINLGGFIAPRTFELTLLRRDRVQANGYCDEFPHSLDKANVLSSDDLKLPENWFNSTTNTGFDKSILCRPQGGINDILCSIEKCWTYAENSNRKLYVDSRNSGISDDFWKYFRPIESIGFVKDDLDYRKYDQLDVIPSVIHGRVSSLKTDYSAAKGGFVDVTSDELVTFNSNESYEASLIVHEQGWTGGVLTSINLLAKLRLTEMARIDINSRLKDLPDNYVAIHIRHTDYTTDFKKLVADIRDSVTGLNVLICSDNVEVVEYVKRELSESNVIRLSTFSNSGNNRIHYGSLGAKQYMSNIEALTDLFALALSKQLYFGNVKEAGRPSGFSLLAYSLHCRKDILNGLFSF